MGIFAWILGRARWSPKRGAKAKRWDRTSLAPNLRVRRLEERRVLNADAAPVQALVVDAGSAAGDGHADTFVVEQHDNQVRISVNGKQISDTPLSQLSKISIHGSSDDDVLIAEFKSGEPMAGLNLLFDGKGGNDSLVLQSNSSVDGVTHNFGDADSNHIDLATSTGTAVVAYSNVESVNDSLAARSRTFNFETGGHQITLGDAGNPADDQSQIEVKSSVDESQLSVVFKNPTHDLTLRTNGSSDRPDTITLNGIDQNLKADTRIHGSTDDLLMVHGPTTFGGNLELSAGTVKVESSLTTSHANLDIHASNEVFIASTGVVQNDAGNIRIESASIEHDGAIVAHGGLVHLDSGNGGTTIVRGTIDVSQSSSGKPAGTVHILGSQVGLLDNARIDASAAVGGGTILIGGDYQGKNSAIRNALQTYVASGVEIRADAGRTGSGGNVIVWADEISQVYGSISARGGAVSGNGGFVETSGKGYLDFRGTVDAAAVNGAAGTWLLDPQDVTVGIVNTNLTLPAFVGGILNTAIIPLLPITVKASDIEAALNAGTNVVITTTAGFIKVEEPIKKTLGGAASLTLAATDTITVDQAITSVLGALDVFINSGADVIINAAIDTLGGVVGVIANGNVSQTAAGTITASILGVRQESLAAGKNVDLIANNHVGVLAVENKSAAGSITFNNSTALTVGTANFVAKSLAFVTTDGLKTNGNVTLNTGGKIQIGTGPGVGGEQDITATGRVILNPTSGGAQELSGSIVTANELLLISNGVPGDYNNDGTVDASDLVLWKKNLGKAVTLPNDITPGTVTLADYTVWQAHFGQSFAAVGGGAFELQEQNAVTTLAATIKGALTFTDLNTLTIGTVVDSDGVSRAGVDTAGNNVTINTGDKLTIGTGAGQDITATGAAIKVILNANAGGVEEKAGSIVETDQLLLQGTDPGEFKLNELNKIATLAAKVNGNLTFQDADLLTIGAVADATAIVINGIDTRGNDPTLVSHDLTLTTGGALTINQAVNAKAMTVTNGGLFTTAAAGDITLDGAFLQNGTGANSLAGDIKTKDKDITLNKAVTLTGNVVVSTDDPAAGGGNIKFVSKIDGAFTLDLTAGAGDITLSDVVGSITPLTGFTASGHDISVHDVTTNGNQQYTATGSITFHSSFFTNGADFIVAGALVLGSSTTVNTLDAGLIVGGNISFGSTINADDATTQNRTLSLTAGTGTVTFGGAIGGAANGALADLDVIAATINLNDPTVIINDQGGNTATFTGAVLLGANVTINTDGAADNSVLFTSTINADNATTQNRTLTVLAGSGAATFGGAIGGAAIGALADLDVTAATINLNNATVTVNDQGGNTATFTGAVLLGANVTINTDGAADNSVLFTSTINADNATTQNRTLTITAGTGTATFNGAIGGGVNGALADLDVTAATINLNNPTVIVNDQGGNTATFTGAAVLGANAITITTDGAADNSLVFNGTVNADNSTIQDRTLTVLAGTGTATFNGAIGGAVNGALADLDVTAATINLNNPTVTVNDQGGNTATFTGAVVLGANVTITTDGAADNSLVFNGTVNADNATIQDRTLTIFADTAAVTFGGAIGAAANGALADLDVNAATINLNGTPINVNDGPGGQTVTFNGAVVLGNSVTINSDGAGDNNVLFTSTINADNSTIQDRTLTVLAGTGTATFNGAIGGAVNGALADLDVTAATINLNNPTVTVNDQGGNTATFTGAVVLGANVIINTDGAADNSVLFTSTINADNATIQDRKLTITAGAGTVTFNGAIGGAVNGALADLDVTAAAINLNDPTVTVNDQGGNTATFIGAVVLGANVIINTDGAADNSVQFNGTINADNATIQDRTLLITAGAGTATFNGSIGGAANGALADLDVNAATINLNGSLINVNDGAGGQTVTFNGAVVLGNIVTINTDGAGDNSVLFTSTINADNATIQDRKLTITAGAGTVTFNGAIGGAVNGALADLDVTAATINLNDPTITVNDQGGNTAAFTGAVVLGANVVITTDGAVDNSVLFNTAATTINADNAMTQNRTLTVTAGTGTVTFNGAIGGAFNGALADLDVTAATINLNNATVTVNDQGSNTATFTGAVVLGANVTITTDTPAALLDNNVEFDTTATSINADAVANHRTLTINAATVGAGNTGTVTFDGPIGNTQALADLDVTAATINLNNGTINVNDQGGNTATLDGAVVLGTDVAINVDTPASSTDNDLLFKGTVNGTVAGNEGLGITGSVTFGDGLGDFVGNAKSLKFVTVSGTTRFNAGNTGTATVETIGVQTYSDSATLGAATTLKSNGGDVSLNGASNSASATGFDLTLDTTTATAGQKGGNVALNSFGNAAGRFVHDFTISTAGPAGPGALTLSGNISLDDNGLADPGDFLLVGGGNVIVANNVTIDTEQGDTVGVAGGEINLGGGTIFGQGADRQFSLIARGNTNGGNIDFGKVDVIIGFNLLGQFRAITNGTGTLTLDAAADIRVGGSNQTLDKVGVTVEANVLVIGANITVQNNGHIVANALKTNDLQAFTLVAGKLLTTQSGSVGAGTFALSGDHKRFVALDALSTVTKPIPPAALTTADNEATVVAAVDDVGERFTVTANWFGTNSPNVTLPPGTMPPLTSTPLFDGGPFNGALIGAELAHNYDEPPDPSNPNVDIIMTLNVTQLAAGTIVPSIGNRLVVDALNTDGTYANNAIGITTELVINVNNLANPTPQTTIAPLPVRTESPPPIVVNAEVVAPVEVSTVQFVPVTGGAASTAEDRYYELRIVYFKKDGRLEEDVKVRIRLDNPKLEALNPFNAKLNRPDKFDLSKLPILFGRLPADHYRLYLIEDGAERMILEFTIQQGQPIEIPEDEGATMATPPGVAPAVNEINGQRPAAEQPAKNGASNGNPRSNKADAFAERLGRASFLSHGGVVVGAAALAFSANGRWEQSIDRLMERFDRRRRFPRRGRLAKREHQLLETSATNSTQNPHQGS